MGPRFFLFSLLAFPGIGIGQESNAYAIGEKAYRGPASHGIQYLPDAKVFPSGSKLAQWVKIDEKSIPGGFGILVKGDGRWNHVAAWGKLDLKPLQESRTAYWFLNTFYRHAKGFLGWGMDLVPRAMEFVPGKSVDRGGMPNPGEWVLLEVPLKDLGVEGKLVDGVGFLHAEGSIS